MSQQSVNLGKAAPMRENNCLIDTCNLNHSESGDTTEPETPFKVHTSAFEYGAIWENLSTGDLMRRVDFGDHQPTAAELRAAADWLDEI